MWFMSTIKVCTDAVCYFLGAEQTCGLHDVSFAMNPVRLDAVEPGALGGQVAGHNTYALASLPDLSIVCPEPVAHLVAHVPRDIVPDHDQSGLAHLFQLLAAPGQIVDSDGANRAPLHKAQPDLFWQGFRGSWTRNQQAITSQRLGVRIVLGHGLLNQTQRFPFCCPSVHVRLRDPAPPDFILKADGIFRVMRYQFNQTVSVSFFRTYAGSGLVIHCLARFQRTPNRCNAVRTASRLTRFGVKLCSKLTSAANSSVHKLVSLPKSRGLWCSNARSRSDAATSNASAVRCGTFEPALRPPTLCG